MGCSSSKDDDFAAHTLENDELFIDGHFKEVVPEAAEKPSTTFVRGQPKPTSWLVGNGSPTQAPVTRRRSWDALPPKAQSTTPVHVAKLTNELDALSEKVRARPAAHKPAPARKATAPVQVSRANSTKTATPQGHRVVTMSSGEMARAPPPPEPEPEMPPPPPTTFSSPPPPPAAAKASPPEPIASPSTPVKALAKAWDEGRGPPSPRSPVSDASDESPVRAGHRVRIVGLEKAAQHNGCEGVVIPKRDGERIGVKLDNGKLLSLKPANLEVQRQPKLEDRIKKSQELALRRAEERRIADAKREEADRARTAAHEAEARRQEKIHDAELEKIAAQKRLNDAEAQEALEAREALRQSSLRKNRAKAKASAATAESTAVKATRAAEEAERIAKAAEAKALEIRKQEALRKARAAERKEEEQKREAAKKEAEARRLAEEETAKATRAKVAEMKKLAEARAKAAKAAQAKKEKDDLTWLEKKRADEKAAKVKREM